MSSLTKKSSMLPPQLQLSKKLTSKYDEQFLIESPSLGMVRRRKSKIFPNKKTNEDLIRQSYQQLLCYVQGVDRRVQQLILVHQSQFLNAYQLHIKKVREEMEAISKQSAKNSQNQQLYVDKIEALEKELAVFRDEALKMFEKVTSKDKLLSEVSNKLKEVAKENDYYYKRIRELTKKNKQLETQLLVCQSKLHNYEQQYMVKQSSVKRDIPYTPQVRTLEQQLRHYNDIRPGTTAILNNSKTLNIRLYSNKKGVNSFNTIQKKSVSPRVQSFSIINSNKLLQPQNIKPQTFNANMCTLDLNRAREKLYSKISRRKANTFRSVQSQSEIIRSQQFAQRREYYEIFKTCVNDIRNDVMKRGNNNSLNFYKQNGPKSFIQFKKIEKYALMELLLGNEAILSKFYQLLFPNKH